MIRRPLINTPLQRGDLWRGDYELFQQFRHVSEAAKPLKRLRTNAELPTQCVEKLQSLSMIRSGCRTYERLDARSSFGGKNEEADLRDSPDPPVRRVDANDAARGFA